MRASIAWPRQGSSVNGRPVSTCCGSATPLENSGSRGIIHPLPVGAADHFHQLDDLAALLCLVAGRDRPLDAMGHVIAQNLLLDAANLFFAFIYNAAGIPVAAGVLYPAFGILLSPIVGAAAMALSSASVVANALRLRHTRL